MQKRKRFGEILIEANVVDQSTLKQALDNQRQTGRRLGQILEKMGVATEKDIAEALSRQFGLTAVTNIAKMNCSAELLKIIDSDTAMDKMIFPLKKEGGTLSLAMVNPLDLETIDKLSFCTGLRIVPCVTTPTEIQAAVNRHYLKYVEQSLGRDKRWTVLVIDDQDLVRSAVISALEHQGYNLLEARDGAEGLKVVFQEKPDLIITDTMMPKVNGFEILGALKGNRELKHIPIIALSAKPTAEEEARLLDMGCFDFIAKPINPVRLVARVKHALRIVYGDNPSPG